MTRVPTENQTLPSLFAVLLAVALEVLVGAVVYATYTQQISLESWARIPKIESFKEDGGKEGTYESVSATKTHSLVVLLLHFLQHSCRT